MKKLFLYFSVLCMTLNMQAQGSKTVTITAGGLATALSADEVKSINNLRIRGEISVSDINFLKTIIKLDTLDLSETKIVGTKPNSLPQLRFYDCCGKKHIILPTTITTIEHDAFNGIRMDSIIIPPSVTEIEYYAFYQSTIQKITIPATVTSLGTKVFYDCQNLRNVNLLATISEIPFKCFEGCRLETLTISRSLTTFNIKEASQYKNIAAIYVEDGNPSFASENGILFNRDKTKLLYWGASKENYTIPSSVTTIGAFAGIEAKTLTIPSSVQTLEDSVLMYSGTEAIKVYCKNPPVCDANAINPSCILFVPYGTKSLYQSSVFWKEFTTIVEFQDNSIYLRDSVMLADSTAQERSTLVISDSIWTARSSDTWLHISPTTGSGFTNTTISIDSNGSGLFRTGSIIFENKNGEKKIITIEQTEKSPFELVASNAQVLSQYQKEQVVKLKLNGEIDIRDFDLMRFEMPKLKSIDLSEARIVAYVSKDNLRYGSDTVPIRAFIYRSLLTDIKLPSTTNVIGASAFEGCYQLESIIIPQQVKEIGEKAFNYCQKFHHIAIPQSVSTIGTAAFNGCSSLDTIVNYSQTPQQVWSGSYINYQNCTLIVPKGSGVSYRKSSGWNLFNQIDDSTSTVTISDSVLTFAKGKVIESISVYVVGEWQLTSNAEWLQFSATSGTNFSKIIITATENAGDFRETQVTITSKDGLHSANLHIKQEAYRTIISSPTAIELSNEDRASVAQLTLTGNIDARDFKIMSDSMPNLKSIQLNTAKIVAYTGLKGTLNYNKHYGADTVPAFAFYSSKITNIILPKITKNIDENAFGSCENLVSINFPDGLVSISASAFYYCKQLQSIQLPQTIRALGDGSFQACMSLQKVNFPEGLTTIGKNVLNVSVRLHSLVIPSTVVSIGTNAFRDCNFDTIINKSMIPQSSWQSNNSINTQKCILFVPFGAAKNYQTAAVWKEFSNIEEFIDSDTTRKNYSIEKDTVASSSVVSVFSENSWTAASNQAWLTINSSTGSNGAKLTMNLEANASNQLRTAEITIVSGSITKTITITQDAQPIPTIELSTQTIDLTSTSTAKVTVTTTGSWIASSDQSWLSISPASGTGNGELTITAEPNTTYEARTAIVKVTSALNSDTSKTIAITQAAKTIPTIELSTQTIDFSTTTTTKVNVTTTGNWTATSDQSWLSISPASGTGNGEITITAEPNTTGATRTATITIATKLKADGNTKTITVTQAAQNTAIANENGFETSIYPNPTQSHITISAPAAEGQVISLIAPNGSVLAQTSVSDGKAEFSVIGLPKGIYTVQLQSNVKAIWQRVIVE